MSLLTEQVYLYPKENSKRHKTDKYELVHEDIPTAILRRGNTFTIAIRFSNRGYNPQTDTVKVVFNYGPNPHPLKGTKGIIIVHPSKKCVVDDEQKNWFGNVLQVDGETISLEIFAPPSISVGLWGLQVETSLKNSTEPENIYEYDSDLYFLFNPWNCHDLVFMPDDRLPDKRNQNPNEYKHMPADEYVLSDIGKIWVGPYRTTKGREWVFGQFDACVLPAIMLMLEKSGLAHTSHGDPIKLTRMISKMVNSNDDDGILVGRWDGEYADGTAPSAWTGSVPILQEYLDTQRPVPYGQCWVFSGVVTTICRALGIPSRVVSNLVSAHDANGTLTVDRYLNANGEEIGDPLNPRGEDSIWNYHVWNDVYMARPDLSPGYGGWQAIDATPQETSDGFYQCGPASLEAIRKGKVGYNYDVAFMIASVNADLMQWKEDKNSELGFTRVGRPNKTHIGLMVLTKQPYLYDFNGDRDRQDITLQYKAKDGTTEERSSLMRAVRSSELGRKFYALPDAEKEDMEFTLMDIDRIKIGENFSVVVKIKNKSSELRSVKCILSTSSIFYTGVKSHSIAKREGMFKIKPNSSEEIRLFIKADDYLEKLVEYCNMKINAMVTVEETNQTWADEDDFQVLKPSISIRVPNEIPVHKPTSVTLRFVSPLKKTLTHCKFNLAGSKSFKNMVINLGDVKAGQLVKTEVVITPRREGEIKLVATFTSHELLDITGTTKVDVVNDEE